MKPLPSTRMDSLFRHGSLPEISIWRRNMRIFANLARIAEPGDVLP